MIISTGGAKAATFTPLEFKANLRRGGRVGVGVDGSGL